MLNKKYFIATGCSFTEGHLLKEKGSWATYFAKNNNLELINLGKGGNGNEFLVYNLINYLTLNKEIAKNSIFGIQLSECLRTLVCLDFPDSDKYPMYWHITPAQFVKEWGFAGWDLSAEHNKFIYENRYSLAPFYTNVTSSVSKTIYSILILVNFFENNNYPYFIFDGLNKNIPQKINDKWQLYNPNQNNDCWDVSILEEDNQIENSDEWLFKNCGKPIISKKTIEYINQIPNYIQTDITKFYLENLGKNDFDDSDFYFKENQGHPNELGSKKWAEYLQPIVENLFGKIN